MLETLKKHWKAKVAFIIFAIFTVWWIFLQFIPKESIYHQVFGETYGILAFWGAISGFLVAKKWGGLKSVLGKAIILLSIGLLAQEFGQLAYAYYIYVLNIDIPYPSLGDIGFFGTIPFYIAAAYLIANASGVKLTKGSFQNKIQAIVIPLLMLGIGYILFLKGYEFDFSNPLKIFLDFGYPLGQAIYISIGILTYSLTRNMLGGIMKGKILFFIIAFSSQFLADYIFLYFQDQYYNGSFIDFMYLVAYFIMAIAIIQLESTLTKLKHDGSK